MAKSEVYRFAFGTPARPGSGVWRVVCNKKTGDIYINAAKEFGNDVHISLHASGFFSFKYGKRREILEPPREVDKTRLLNGPCIFFYLQDRLVPPPLPSGSISKVRWLGWPETESVITVRTFFARPDQFVRPGANGQLICGPVKSKLFKKSFYFHMIAEHRKLNAKEIQAIETMEPFNLEYPESLPKAVDVFSVSTAPEGVSTITVQRFSVSLKD